MKPYITWLLGIKHSIKPKHIKSVSLIGTSHGLRKTSSSIFYWQKKCTDLICPKVYCLPDTVYRINQNRKKNYLSSKQTRGNFILFMSIHRRYYFTQKSNTLIYAKTHFIHYYTPTCFRPQRVILREYWYISGAESTKYVKM